jgi:aminotransferase
MLDRTVTMSGFSKTYSATGWRVGYIVAPKNITGAIRKVHDFLTVCAPTPIQEACITALKLPESFYQNLRKTYDQSRNLLYEALENAGFECTKPEGSYYIWTDFSNTGFKDDHKLAEYLVMKVGVGSVPGSSFYHQPSLGRRKLRFSFSKRPSTIKKAIGRLKKFRTR